MPSLLLSSTPPPVAVEASAPLIGQFKTVRTLERLDKIFEVERKPRYLDKYEPTRAELR
jgi:hypothetical protein